MNLSFESWTLRLPALLLVGVAAFSHSRSAYAEPSMGSSGGDLRPIVGSRLVAAPTGGGFAFDVRARFASGVQVGVDVAASAHEHAFMSGQRVNDVGTLGGTAIFLLPLVFAGPLEFDLRAESGLSALYGLGDVSTSALRQVNELGMVAHVALGRRWLFRAGALLGFELEVRPTTDLADQSQLLTAGLGVAILDDLLLHTDVTGGGTYGFDGDNGKFIFEGTLGVRYPFGGGGSRVAY